MKWRHFDNTNRTGDAQHRGETERSKPADRPFDRESTRECRSTQHPTTPQQNTMNTASTTTTHNNRANTNITQSTRNTPDWRTRSTRCCSRAGPAAAMAMGTRTAALHRSNTPTRSKHQSNNEFEKRHKTKQKKTNENGTQLRSRTRTPVPFRRC